MDSTTDHWRHALVHALHHRTRASLCVHSLTNAHVCIQTPDSDLASCHIALWLVIYWERYWFSDQSVLGVCLCYPLRRQVHQSYAERTCAYLTFSLVCCTVFIQLDCLSASPAALLLMTWSGCAGLDQQAITVFFVVSNCFPLIR